MVYEDRLQGPLKQDGIPPRRAGGAQMEPAAAARRGRWLTPRLVSLTLTIILLGAGAGVAGALVLPKPHGARAEILYAINGSDQGGDPLRQDRELSTQLVLLKNRAVLGPVAQKQGMRFDDLQRDVDASVVQNSTVIQVEVSGNNDQAAIQTLQAVMDNYLTIARQPTAVARNLNTMLTQARERTAQLQAQETRLRPQVLAGTTPQTTLDDTRAQLTASRDWEVAIQGRINEVGLNGQAGSGAQMLTPPYAIPDPTIPRWLSAAGIGALIGLVVAVAMLTIGALRATASTAGQVDPQRSR